MTLFGKLLLVVNLLAAGGFVYLATQNWKGRQTINASGLRHQLLLSGVPLEEEREKDATYGEDEIAFVFRDGPGGVPTDRVSKKLLDAYFQAAPGGESLGGPAVISQVAEVKRVKDKIEGQVKESAEKIGLLSGYLLLQADSYDERLEIQALADAKNADELEKRLLAKFDAVINPSKPADPESLSKLKDDDNPDAKAVADKLAKVADGRSTPGDASDRRDRIARLLVHLSADAAWQKRVMVVVGLRRYVSAVATQAGRFRDMSARVERLLLTDQAGYLSQLVILNQLARAGTDLALRQSDLKKQWTAQKIKEDDFVAQRQTQLTTITNQLNKIKAEVDEMLARQATIESGLFEVQREVALTLDEVYKLEAALVKREQELLEAAPKP